MAFELTRFGATALHGAAQLGVSRDHLQVLVEDVIHGTTHVYDFRGNGIACLARMRDREV